MIRKVLIVTFVFALAVVEQISAQSQLSTGKKKSRIEKSPLSKSEKKARILFFPEFFHRKPMKQGDTTLSFECYDKNNHILYLNHITNTEEIDHMLYFKSFSRDPIQFMLVFSYGHPSANLWVRYDQNTGELKRYKVNGDKIIRTDKELTTDPVTHAQQTTVYNYLKTEVLLPEE